MQPSLLGSMRSLQFTVNAFPTHAVSVPAVGPWRLSAQILLIQVKLDSSDIVLWPDQVVVVGVKYRYSLEMVVVKDVTAIIFHDLEVSKW